MYRLIQDDDCHWYVIPASREYDFHQWAASDEWEAPGWAVRVDGPHVVEFPNPFGVECATLAQLQKDQFDWALRNFGESPAYHPLLGALEELGELAHAHLKHEQGIRGMTDEEALAAKIDAVADCIIYLANYCSIEGIDLQEAVFDTWQRVRQRNWKEDPESGGEGA